jgi:hypothetical protein
METLLIPSSPATLQVQETSSDAFLVANTTSIALPELEHKHIIPVFVKDNEPVISHHDFISATQEVLSHTFPNMRFKQPALRVSHAIKGRIPDAKHKAAKELLEHEKTIYYERMAFVIEIPDIQEKVNGNTLSLTVGGVKAYNLDNLYNRKGAEEHFKVFIGFQNKVCTNLCISTDGLQSELKVRSIGELMKKMYQLFNNYKPQVHLNNLRGLDDFYLTEHQFATLIGRSRLYQHLPSDSKRGVPLLQFGDNQLGIVAREYFKDESFCRELDGSINLWKVYNLFTGANKQSYIDTFLDRGLNALEFTNELKRGLKYGTESNWFLS